MNDIIYRRKYINNFVNPFVRLYTSKIKSSKVESVAKLIIIHGFAHHSFDFYEFSTYLALNGIVCYLVDLRGHGYSGGERLEWSIEDFHTDIISLITESEKDSFDLPMFILGHSMGGGLISNLFINNPYLQVHGVIFSAPLFGTPLTMMPENYMKTFLLKSIGYDLKDFVVHGGINVTALTKDDKEVISMIRDNKNLPMSTPNSCRSLIKMFERTLDNCRYFSLNTIIFHGDKDKVTNKQHSKIFYDNIKSKQKELVIVNNAYHEIYKDLEKKEFYVKILNFILKNKNTGKTDKRNVIFNYSFSY